MPNNDTKHPVIRCSFCGKSEAMVHKLIEGPGVYICDECIALCNDILAEANRSARKPQNSACNNNNMLVVIPSIIGGYNNIKNNLTGGSIILLEDTSNIDIIIKYINSKGYNIVPLSNLLEE